MERARRAADVKALEAERRRILSRQGNNGVLGEYESAILRHHPDAMRMFKARQRGKKVRLRKTDYEREGGR